jgi:hypothetical protein
MLTKAAHPLKIYSHIKSEVPTLNCATAAHFSTVHNHHIRNAEKKDLLHASAKKLVYPSETSLPTKAFVEKLLTSGSDPRTYRTDTLPGVNLLSFKCSTHCQS